MNLKDVIKKDRLREFLDYGTIYNPNDIIVFSEEDYKNESMKNADFAIVTGVYKTWRQSNKVIKMLNEREIEFDGQRMTFRYPTVAETVSILHKYSDSWPVLKTFRRYGFTDFFWTSEKIGQRVFCQSVDIDHGRVWKSLTDFSFLMVIGELK